MVALLRPANTDDNNEQLDFSPVPDGDYNVKIVGSEIFSNKNTEGNHYCFQMVITDGQYAGRMIFDRITRENSSPKAVEIGIKQMNSLCSACNKFGVYDTAHLHECMINIRVVVDGDYNRVKSYSPYVAPSGHYEPVQQPAPYNAPGSMPYSAPPATAPTSAYYAPTGQQYAPAGHPPGQAAPAPHIPGQSYAPAGPAPAPHITYAPPGQPHPSVVPEQSVGQPGHTTTPPAVSAPAPFVPKFDHTAGGTSAPAPSQDASEAPWVEEQRRMAAAAANNQDAAAPGAVPSWARK